MTTTSGRHRQDTEPVTQTIPVIPAQRVVTIAEAAGMQMWTRPVPPRPPVRRPTLPSAEAPWPTRAERERGRHRRRG